MNPEDFFDIDVIQEDYDLEVKGARGADGKGKLPKSLWETYSAMANTEGGYIVLGIEQKGAKFIPYGVPNPEKLIKELWDCLNNPKKVSVNLLSTQSIRIQEIEEKKILWICIPRASRKQRPVYLNGNPLTNTYRRNFEGDYKCSEDFVTQMLGEQANDTKDAVLLDRFGMEDISLSTLQLYRQHFANRSPHHPFNDYGHLEFLQNLGGWIRDRQSGAEGVSLAGLLMFGKLRSILDAVPDYVVDYQERPRAVTELRWIDRVTTDFTWSGNLYDFYQSVIKRLFDGLQVPFAIEGDTRVDNSPVHVALREALVNTLIHADYAGTCSILVVKRPDLFGFRNPGVLRISREDVLRGGNSDCRNRNLQKMFQMVGLGEQAGSGVPKIYQNWNSQHWKRPILEERFDRNQTVLAMEMSSLVPTEAVEALQLEMGDEFDQLDKTERLASVVAWTEGCVTHRRLMELTKDHPHDLTLKLHSLVDRGVLESDGQGRSTFYYLPGRHPIKGDELGIPTPPLESRMKNSLHNGTSSLHNGENSLHNEKEAQDRKKHNTLKSNEIDSIATMASIQKRWNPKMMRLFIHKLCYIKELSLRELSGILKRNEETLRTRYVSPMCSEGLLVRKYPNIINHPDQKYRAYQKPTS